MRRFPPAPETAAFANLPVRFVSLDGATRIAVHMRGTLDHGELPIVCLAGYHRNMSDFSDFLPLARNILSATWPIILIDMPGRGRSSDRPIHLYTSVHDAHAVAAILTSMGVSRAIFLGQSHGGQVIMALTSLRPNLITAAILIDAGAVADPRGLVRMRNNLQHALSAKGKKAGVTSLRQMLSADYPDLDESRLDALVARAFIFTGAEQIMPLFDPVLVDRLGQFTVNDVFEARWDLFNGLRAAELMLLRGQLSDHLRRETFEQMESVRSDAVTFSIPGQGSPALLNGIDEVGAIADFIRYTQKNRV